MAPRAKKEKTEEVGSARRGSNFDPAATNEFVKRIETLKAEIQVHKDDCKATCEPINEDIKAIYEEAEVAGITPALLKAAVRKRKLEADAQKLRDKFDGGTRDDYDALLLALGELDTPAARKAA